MTNLSAPPEAKGFIGERFDADAGLQFLNARYYDPKLAMFIQPDWFEVTKAGVGTNRYSYSFNDPVNKMDPEGNVSRNYDSNGDGTNDAWEHISVGSARERDYYEWQAAHANQNSSISRAYLARNGGRIGSFGDNFGNSSGVGNGYYAYSSLTGHGLIPQGIRNNVYINPATGLSVSGNVISGGATYYCGGSAGFCGKISRAFGKIVNHSAGGFKMNYHLIGVGTEKEAKLIVMERALRSKVPNARGEYLHVMIGGVYKHMNIINISPGTMTEFSNAKFGYIIRHELGHWMGLGHQLGHSSIMAYGRGAPKNFSGTDLMRLSDAY